MSEEKDIQEKLEDALSSPIPLLTKILRLIFGETKPIILLQVCVYINLLFWFIFQLWHILSYFAISYRAVILSEKKINVEILILNRGRDLNFDPSVFLENLMSFHKIAIFLWLSIFVGTVLMWRRQQLYKYFVYIPLLIYPLIALYLLGKTYLYEDTTFFDKLSFFLVIINSLLYTFMLKQVKDGEIDFFRTES